MAHDAGHCSVLPPLSECPPWQQLLCVSCPFSSWCVCVCVYVTLEFWVACTFWMEVLFQSVACHSVPFTRTFLEPILILLRSSLSIYAFVECASGVKSKNTSPNLRSPRFSPHGCFLQSFLLWCSALMSTIHWSWSVHQAWAQEEPRCLPEASSCCSTICWNGHPSSTELCLYLFQNPAWGFSVGLRHGSLFCSVDPGVSALLPEPQSLDYYSFVVSSVVSSDPSHFRLLLQDCF